MRTYNFRSKSLLTEHALQGGFRHAQQIIQLKGVTFLTSITSLIKNFNDVDSVFDHFDSALFITHFVMAITALPVLSV
jgi:hypothetical protein